MFRKLIAGGAALAIAAAALLLVSVPGGVSTSEAAVDSIAPSTSTIAAGATTVVKINADDTVLGAADVRILITAGSLTSATCSDGAAAFVACAVDGTSTNPAFGATIQDVTVDDTVAVAAGGGVDTIDVVYTAPAIGPGVATMTAIQGTSAKSTDIKHRGSADTVTVVALTAAPAAGSTCPGTVANVINSSTATVANGGVVAGNLCTLVKDSSGNRLPTAAVQYSTTAGTVAPLTDTTTGTGSSAVASALTAGSSGTNGKTGTVTASSGGKTGTVDVSFGGNPVSCTLTASPTEVAVGGAATTVVALIDDSGGPIPDGIFTAVAQVNPGAGANAAIIGSPAPSNVGTANATVIAALAGPIALGATAPTSAVGAAIVGASPTINCTGTVTATGQVDTTPPPAGGAPSITGFAPGAGQSGLIVFNNLSTIADGFALICGGNVVGSSITLTNTAGVTNVNVNGAPALANGAFNANQVLGGTQAGFGLC